MTDPNSRPQGSEPRENLDFLRGIVRRDIDSGVYGGRVVTRFPPEPNGFLHIGHAKSICINFGIATEFGGACHLRFDDTNPETEDMKYVESIQRDVRWLGFDWKEKFFFASDYYETLYELAIRLIRDGKAYVDSQSDEEIRKGRGTITEPGTDSPHRNRTVEENLDLFARMKAGEFPDGAHVLRAKIDMAARNMKLRDPLLYRIRHATHYRRGDAWCIYPMYDFAHPLSDAIEGITHSICTLEFENNRAIYDWLVDNLFPEPRPRQYEFARLNLDYTVMSKRKLLQLVEEGLVSGWDDPRMPTIAGMRRRGYAPEGIRLFASRIGVDKANSRVSMELLEDAIRDDLNTRAPRAMVVLRPLKVTITNWPDDRVEGLEIPLWPRDIGKEGARKVPLAREIRIERTDFSPDPPADWRRLRLGGETRLMGGYFIRCDEVVHDPATGEVAELRCSYDPESLGA
ncbi:glutamine--tRNA ligase/YqeY domain fusion protein, partial [Candidatus Deferrimicrobium sp.]|uniref:glutamine--tRNA ligase/YqeY domain fusion protein n=1 Tax=Candidatus Deferrimicrobium sp. TaxID=3060586 RepID=UPI00271ACC04